MQGSRHKKTGFQCHDKTLERVRARSHNSLGILPNTVWLRRSPDATRSVSRSGSRIALAGGFLDSVTPCYTAARPAFVAQLNRALPS